MAINPINNLGRTPPPRPSANPNAGYDFGKFFGDKSAQNTRSLKLGLKKELFAQKRRNVLRHQKFGAEDKTYLEELMFGDKNITRDGFVSKGELAKVLRTKVKPYISKRRDPKTGKWLDPTNVQDRKRFNELKEAQDYLKQMIKK